MIKNPPTMQRLGFDPWVRKISWRKKWQPIPANIFAWEIPWTEEPGGYRSWGHKRVGHDLVTKQQHNIEFVTILFLFHVLGFLPPGMWDGSSLTMDWTLTPCIGRQSLNHRTAREVSLLTPLIQMEHRDYSFTGINIECEYNLHLVMTIVRIQGVNL